MNEAKIKMFLKSHDKTKFLKYQAQIEPYNLTDDDIDYMCKMRYISHIKDDQYISLQKGSDFAFSRG